MELHIKERLLIAGILPEQNNFVDFNLKKSILKKVSITAQDKKDFDIVENKQTKYIEWNLQKDKETPLMVDFTKEETKYLVQACEAIADESLSDDIWEVVEQIYDKSHDHSN